MTQQHSRSQSLRLWLMASLVAMVAAVTFLVAALVDQSAINNRIDAAGQTRVKSLTEEVIAQLDADPTVRPPFFDELSDLWFVSRLQNVSDQQFLAGLGDAAPRYLAAYEQQLLKQPTGTWMDGDRERPLVNANDHFLRGLLRSAVHGPDAISRTLADLDLALTLQPDHDSALATRGRLAREAAQFPVAVADLQRAVDINPLRWSVWLELARAHRGMGNAEAAAQAYEQAIAHAPESLHAEFAAERDE